MLSLRHKHRHMKRMAWNVSPNMQNQFALNSTRLSPWIRCCHSLHSIAWALQVFSTDTSETLAVRNRTHDSKTEETKGPSLIAVPPITWLCTQFLQEASLQSLTGSRCCLPTRAQLGIRCQCSDFCNAISLRVWKLPQSLESIGVAVLTVGERRRACKAL